MLKVSEQVKYPNPTLLPATYYGVKSEEEWNRLGEARGLVLSIGRRYGNAKMLEFAHGELFKETMTLTPEMMLNLHSVQKHVVMEVVEEYASNKRHSEDLPVILKWNEEFFIFQGTHRISAAILTGTNLVAFYYDCDNIKDI